MSRTPAIFGPSASTFSGESQNQNGTASSVAKPSRHSARTTSTTRASEPGSGRGEAGEGMLGSWLAVKPEKFTVKQ